MLAGSAYGTGRLGEIAENSAIESMSVEKSQEDYGELLANTRRLTIMVLGNLETGTRDRTLSQGEKRLLSSTGTRL